MRGVGGPLLCIGDLLCDVGESEDNLEHPIPQIQTPSSPSPSALPSSSDIHLDLHPSRLTQLFQENYEQLNKALAGTDHSWTCLTLKLCTALDTAKKLIESTNSNVTMLSENVGELEKMIKKGDSAIAEENYEQLNKALAGTDHSWTCLTLKLCTALDTAKKLIESTNSNVTMLSENVGELEKMIKKGDSAIAEVRSIHSSISQRIAPSSENES